MPRSRVLFKLSDIITLLAYQSFIFFFMLILNLIKQILLSSFSKANKTTVIIANIC